MTTEQNTEPNLIDLKTARENSGLTLKDWFERTRISVVNLEAIENGDFHLLSVPLYARNFIKTYADALGVDSKPVLQRYEDYLHTLQQMKENAQMTEQPPQAHLATTFGRYRVFLWGLCIVIVFAAVSLFVSIYNKPSPEISPKIEVPKKTVIAETLTQNAAQPDAKLPITVNLQKPQNLITANPENDVTKPPAQKITEVPAKIKTSLEATPQSDEDKGEALADEEEPSTLVVRATEESWIRIQADDKEPFQVLLKPGEKISHKAARFNVDVGNAGGVKLQLDGKNIEHLGKSGQVIHLRLPQN